MIGSREDTLHKNGALTQILGHMGRARRKVRNCAYVLSNGLLGQFNGLRKGTLRVALISSKEWKGKEYDDLLLQRALVKAGAKAEIVAFNDLSVDYAKYDRVVIRSMWGYQKNLNELSDWMERLEKSGVKILNSLEIIRENYDKRRQFERLKDLPVIPTLFIGINELSQIETFHDFLKKIHKNKDEFCPDFPFVVKPGISASGENTFLIKSEESFSSLLPKMIRVNARKELMVQPYIPEISDGELGVIMISGEITHIVRRFPGVLSGEKYKVELYAHEIDDKLTKICKKASEKYHGALYLRVDLVKRGNDYMIMEVEAFEPALFFYLLHREERKINLDKMVKGILR